MGEAGSPATRDWHSSEPLAPVGTLHKGGRKPRQRGDRRETRGRGPGGNGIVISSKSTMIRRSTDRQGRPHHTARVLTLQLTFFLYFFPTICVFLTFFSIHLLPTPHYVRHHPLSYSLPLLLPLYLYLQLSSSLFTKHNSSLISYPRLNTSS